MRWDDCRDDIHEAVFWFLGISQAKLANLRTSIDSPPPTLAGDREPDLIFALDRDQHGPRPVIAPAGYY